MLLAPLPLPLAGRAVVREEPLNDQRCVRVTRLYLDARGSGPSTVIVKSFDPSVRPEAAAIEAPFFEAEAAAYRFLTTREPRQRLWPRCLGEDRDTLWLEDLGSPGDLLPLGAIMEAVGETLAQLHAATAGGEEAYVELRGAAGRSPEDDPRSRNSTWGSQGFVVGSRMLREWSSIVLPERGHEFGDLVDAAAATLRDDGPFRALVHNDLSSRRQCVIKDGRVHLLDFEHAKFGHCLVDLAKLMIGKLEASSEPVFVHTHPSLPPGMAGIYRRKLAEHGIEVDDERWHVHLLAALLVHAVNEVGCAVMQSRRQFDGTLVSTLRGLLDRFAAQAEAAAGGARARELATELGSRLLG